MDFDSIFPDQCYFTTSVKKETLSKLNSYIIADAKTVF